MDPPFPPNPTVRSTAPALSVYAFSAPSKSSYQIVPFAPTSGCLAAITTDSTRGPATPSAFTGDSAPSAKTTAAKHKNIHRVLIPNPFSRHFPDGFRPATVVPLWA